MQLIHQVLKPTEGSWSTGHLLDSLDSHKGSAQLRLKDQESQVSADNCTRPHLVGVQVQAIYQGDEKGRKNREKNSYSHPLSPWGNPQNNLFVSLYQAFLLVHHCLEPLRKLMCTPGLVNRDRVFKSNVVQGLCHKPTLFQVVTKASAKLPINSLGKTPNSICFISFIKVL